jgi:hypothetical protein
MRRANFLFALITFTCVSSAVIFAQKVVRVTGPDAVNPAEVTIAINPKNPDNVVASSLAARPSRPPYGSYNYASMDGGLTWKTTPVANPKGLTQGDDVVYFGPTARFITFIFRSSAFASRVPRARKTD